jgi:hypothetical protein
MSDALHARSKPTVIPPLMYSREEAAAATGIGVRKLFDLLAPRGPVPIVRIGSRVLIPVDGLRAFIASEAAKTPTKGGAEA